MSNYKFQYGGKTFKLVESDEFVVVRTKSGRLLEDVALSSKSRKILSSLKSVLRLPDAGVEVLSTQAKGKSSRDLRNKSVAGLLKESDTRFAGKVLIEPKSKHPILYTENFFVKFNDDAGTQKCKKVMKDLKLNITKEIEYLRNGFFISAKERTGKKVFSLAEALINNPLVDLAHPELVQERDYRQFFPQQWHLNKTNLKGQSINQHANVVKAWEQSQGEGITIAVIDDGCDMGHDEFKSSGKIVDPRDVTQNNNDPSPKQGDRHGTACSGVACADGRFGASGVAPKSKLMPIRLRSGLGSQDEADAFVWAADHGADVISCSWGPVDGPWWDPDHPDHDRSVPLPDSTRLAIDWAVNNGRNGKGCVITWAAGNGNERVENDGYASYKNVIAVAACNDQGKKSVYSDKGEPIWCSFPSSDPDNQVTPGIWTTDNSGHSGYNSGDTNKGDSEGNFTNSFGGTSSACPGAAGVAALVLSRNPALRWDEAKEILKNSCDKIDTANGNYDQNDHSQWYGYGRLNAHKAVSQSLPPQHKYKAIHTAVQDVAIKDFKTSTLAVSVGDSKPLKDIKVSVDIEHTYIGDLIVDVLPPDSMGTGSVNVHSKSGEGTNNLKKSFDRVNTPDLQALVGKNPQGIWKLKVKDTAGDDQGQVKSFSLEISL
jgi:subtilisin family serine protease